MKGPGNPTAPFVAWLTLVSMHRRGHPRREEGFLKDHSLSLAASGILLVWVVLYSRANPGTHWGSFFGNAIADWTGVLLAVVGTKYFYEVGSAESRRPHGVLRNRVLEKMRKHSLTIFLLTTGAGWVWVYTRMDSEAKWGQVVGNIVSEWTQLLGLVLMTKRLFENKSKESERD